MKYFSEVSRLVLQNCRVPTTVQVVLTAQKQKNIATETAKSDQGHIKIIILNVINCINLKKMSECLPTYGPQIIPVP